MRLILRWSLFLAAFLCLEVVKCSEKEPVPTETTAHETTTDETSLPWERNDIEEVTLQERKISETSSLKWVHPPNCNDQPTYHIRLHFISEDFPTKVKRAVRAASKLWSRAIVGKRSNPVSPTGIDRWNVTASMVDACGDKAYGMQEDGNTFVVCLHYWQFSDDNPFVAMARPMLPPTDNSMLGLPFMARIDFNARHASQRSFVEWTNLATHELGHALGFDSSLPVFDQNMAGTNWFRGRNAIREWRRLGAPIRMPPLESKVESHWLADCFYGELMSPYVDSTAVHRLPLSRMTLAAFEDMGYEVNYNCTDAFSVLDETTCNEQLYLHPLHPRLWPVKLRQLRKRQAKKRNRWFSKVRRATRRCYRSVNHKLRRIETVSHRRWWRKVRRIIRRQYRSANKRIRRLVTIKNL